MFYFTFTTFEQVEAYGFGGLQGVNWELYCNFKFFLG